MKKRIKILNYLPAVVSTRSSINKLVPLVAPSEHNDVIFDFQNVLFISRSASDELNKLITKCSLQSTFINTNKNVESMLKIVKTDKKSASQEFAITKIDSSVDLISFFATV